MAIPHYSLCSCVAWEGSGDEGWLFQDPHFSVLACGHPESGFRIPCGADDLDLSRELEVHAKEKKIHVLQMAGLVRHVPSYAQRSHSRFC